MRTTRIVVFVLALGALLGGCGTSETKRAVDPRIEVLRFFGPSVDVVALVRTDRLGQLPEIESAMSDIRGYAAIADLLDRAGLTPSGLRELVEPGEEPGEVQAPELAIGADDLAFSPPVLALDTEDEERLDRVFRRREASGEVRPAPGFHDARLYSGGGVAYATRDGVLLASTSLAPVRTALAIRDGDRDGQLDDGEVNDLLDKLPASAAVHAYADYTALIAPDFALNALAARTPWLAAMGLGSLSLAANGPEVELDAFAQLDRESLDEADLPAGEEFSAFSLSRQRVASLLTAHGDSQLRAPLLAMAPITGDSSASTDELRAQVALAP
jgi:hypothetical protein